MSLMMMLQVSNNVSLCSEEQGYDPLHEIRPFYDLMSVFQSAHMPEQQMTKKLPAPGKGSHQPFSMCTALHTSGSL